MIPVYFVISERRGIFNLELIRPTQEAAKAQAARISKQSPDSTIHVLLSKDAFVNGERQ